MSVLLHYHTIPKPRMSGDPVVDVDAPAIKPASKTPTSGPSRTALLVSGAAIITAAAAGTTVYVLAGDSSAPRQTGSSDLSLVTGSRS